LVGVLIFLTLERKFEEKEYISKRRSLRTKYSALSHEVILHKEKLKILKSDLYAKEQSKAHGASTVTDEDIKQIQEQIHETEKIINKKGSEYERLIGYANSLTKKHLQKYDQYMKIRSIEGFVTISMISLLLASIIVLLLYPYPLWIYGSPVSSWLFSAGLVFLLVRIILHGRDPEQKENKKMLKRFKPFLRK
jgi:hypothetical protein